MSRAAFVIAGATLLALPVAALLGFVALLGDVCGNDDLRETISPSGAFKAVLFRRDCGATTACSTQLSILPVWRKLPNEGGNVFVVAGEPWIEVRWLDDTHLAVSGTGGCRVFHQLSDFRGVQIQYQ